MHDLKEIRDDPDAFDAGLRRRGLEPRAGEILALDKDLRKFIAALEDLQQRRNKSSKAIGAAKAKGDEAEAARLMAEVEDVKAQMPTAEAERERFSGEIEAILAGLPNAPAADVPEGVDEAGNVEVRRIGEPRATEAARDHVDLGEALGMLDFERAAAISGARFSLTTGPLARLERALAAFMIDLHTEEFGYLEVAPPFLARDAALYGTGQLPKFKEDLFETTTGYWLLPTAEVSLTNMVADRILDEEALPMRLTAHTPCFRSEAGSAGRDTRGMIRLHQFNKVELVSITTPAASDAEHERMTECAEAVLKRLELPFRTMVLCAGDMGFSARKTYDIEVWLPGQGAYREISSCSNCGPFQARRMKARYRPQGEKATRPVHTLNGSGLATGRALVAVMENYQNSDGSIAVPDALRPYMGGRERIARDG
ncbi:MAG: serine--tRNA ligase [Parvularculaceae bacterium]